MDKRPGHQYPRPRPRVAAPDPEPSLHNVPASDRVVPRQRSARAPSEKCLAALEQLAVALGATRTPEDIAEVIARGALSVFGAEQAVLLPVPPGLDQKREPLGTEEWTADAGPATGADGEQSGHRRILPDAPSHGVEGAGYRWAAGTQRRRGPTQSPSTPESRSAMMLPLQAGGRDMGTLRIDFARGRDVDHGERRCLHISAGLAAQALECVCLRAHETAWARTVIERARTAEEQLRTVEDRAHMAEERVRCLGALQEVTARLAVVRRPEDISDVVMTIAAPLLGAGASNMRVYSDDGSLVLVQGYVKPTLILPLWQRVPTTGGLPAALAARGNTMVVIESLAQACAQFPDLVEQWKTRGVAAFVAAPMAVEGRVIGSLSFLFAQARTYMPDDLTFIAAVAGLAAQALERARLYIVERERAAAAEELAGLRLRQAEEARAIAAVGAALASTLEPDRLYEVMLEEVAKILPCDHACILRYDAGWAIVAASWGQAKQAVGTRVFPLSAIDPIAAFGSCGKPALIADTSSIDWIDVPPFEGNLRIHSEVTVPLQLGGVAVGAFNVDSFTPNFYTEQHLGLAVALGERVTQALLNARLYQAEQQRARAAESLAVLRDGFVASVSHELRTPLTAIIGYGELLQARWHQIPDHERLARIDRIVVSGNRLQRLVSDLLMVNQLETEVLAPVAGLVPVAPLVLQAAEEVRASYPGQQIGLDGRDDLLAVADPHRTLQVLVNLMDNAAKYSPIGCPIEVDWVREGSQAVLRVRDGGKGIGEPGREQLFTRFGRIPGSVVRAGRVGTGLGLYLGRLLARAMGGDLALESTGPSGSVFCLQLPAGAESSVAREQPAP